MGRGEDEEGPVREVAWGRRGRKGVEIPSLKGVEAEGGGVKVVQRKPARSSLALWRVRYCKTEEILSREGGV